MKTLTLTRRELCWLNGECPDCRAILVAEDADDRICPACEKREMEADYRAEGRSQEWQNDPQRRLGGDA